VGDFPIDLLKVLDHGLAHPWISPSTRQPPSPSAHLLFCSLTPCKRRTAWKHQSSRKKAPRAILCDLFGRMVKWPFQRLLATSQFGFLKRSRLEITKLRCSKNQSLQVSIFWGVGEMRGSFWCSQAPGFTGWVGINVRLTFLLDWKKNTFPQKMGLKVPLRHRNLQWPLHFTANRKLKLPT